MLFEYGDRSNEAGLPKIAGAACGEFLRSNQTAGRDEETIDRMPLTRPIEALISPADINSEAAEKLDLQS